MFNFLLEGAFAPFTLALALLFGLLALELIALVLGGSLLAGEGEVDLDVMDAPDLDIGDLGLDIDADVDLGDFELAEVESDVPDAAAAGPLAWLGIGKIPFMIWLVVLLAGFGLSGMGLQMALRDLLGFDLTPWMAAIPAGAFGLWFARGFGSVFTRLLPKTETEAISERMLARRRGVITQGTASRGRPAEVRVMDRFGNTHYLRAEPLQDKDALNQGTDVLVLRDRRRDRFVLVGLSN
ncbi:OB-fold-containig protein [Ruegeria meonggei]|uniref:Inner membrane protein YqiJ n=1 Tax=Ruegeria meonggei TaxID=1446476 RepID=A0A1X6YPS1_9RHOB|nr:OB-fold-containig protein [Ruegeria meonggei]SLN27583.1 Inner membrane protein YqiJ [Ruegeria meonggei]